MGLNRVYFLEFTTDGKIMRTLQKIESSLDKFAWVDYDYYPDSKGSKFEVYSNSTGSSRESLIGLFYYMFRDCLPEIVIGPPAVGIEWGQFCIDTWDFKSDEPNYDLASKSFETLNYLDLLLESNIEFVYQGLCKCNNWDEFLSVVLDCIITHKAPYSFLFYNLTNDYFFYFHHTDSLGVFYKEKNVAISNIFSKIESNSQLSHDQK